MFINSRRLIVVLAVCLALSAAHVASGEWKNPDLLPPDLYGNIIIDRNASRSGVLPVTFSHWIHRTKYTCRVCHTELEFNMEVNTTYITEDDNLQGRFCGACHNGEIAFGHPGNCKKCHNWNIGYGREKFDELAGFPQAPFGNMIDWIKAVDFCFIEPETSLDGTWEKIDFDKELELEAEWSFVPSAFFSHRMHNKWLDCANCHPEIFNVKKKGTENFLMRNILKNEFCGVCHGKVAFPVNDCRRCHPAFEKINYP